MCKNSIFTISTSMSLKVYAYPHFLPLFKNKMMYFCTMKIEYEIQINDIATQVFLENKKIKMWKFYGNMLILI